MKWSVRLFALILLLMTIAITLARRDDSGWIAFVSHEGFTSDVYLMTGDGRWRRQVTVGDTCRTMPRWSPDGKWIAFIDSCGNMQRVHRIRPNGLSMEALHPEPLPLSNLQWTADGSKLLATSRLSDLYIVEIGTNNISRLISGYYSARLSPYDNWVYAAPEGAALISLERIHIDTEQIEQLLPQRNVFIDMDWAPDSTQVVLAMRSSDGYELFLTNTDVDALTLIPVDLPGSQLVEPRWSPNGEWISFVAIGTDTSYVYKVRPNGQDLVRLSNQNWNLGGLQWSPDGKWLLAQAYFEDSWNIVRVSADGSTVEHLISSPAIEFQPHYAPVSGMDWHPFGMALAALGMLAASFMWKRRA